MFLDQLREGFREHFGIFIENCNQPRPDITRVESAVAISHIFNHDAERQRLKHELDMRSEPLIPTNAASLGRVGKKREPMGGFAKPTLS
jgi:hypothetical protein